MAGLTLRSALWQDATDFMAQPREHLRIGDIARLAGVSAATVSRVLSGSPRVRPEARERVLAVAARFDYQPSPLARHLRRGRTDVVGVVVSDIENPHFASLVQAIEDAVYRRGRRVLLCNTSEDAAKESAYLEMLAVERVLGVLLSPSEDANPPISALMDLGIPVVAFDRSVADPRADSVTADNRGAAKQAAQLLIDLGHRRIGLVAGRPGVQTADERLAGYVAAMAGAGLQPLVRQGGFSLDGGRTAAAELIAERPAVTALLIANNLMTLGALAALRESRLRVPDGMALVAFDDPPWAQLIDPPLTALAQPLRTMADVAVSLLFERIADPQRPPAHPRFDLDLHIRRSSGDAVPA
jgi:DNA-binding LacI/PurR family transcriptional regulator